MQPLQTSFTLSFNRRHRQSGHVFEQRYKALVVDRDNYLLHVSRYIHSGIGSWERPDFLPGFPPLSSIPFFSHHPQSLQLSQHVISVGRAPVEAMTLRTVAKFVLCLPHVLRHPIMYRVFGNLLQRQIAGDAAGEEGSQRIEMKSINDLLELLAETITMNKNKRRSVLTAPEASIASQDEPSLSPALTHDSCGRKLGQIGCIIPQNPQPTGQLA